MHKMPLFGRGSQITPDEAIHLVTLSHKIKHQSIVNQCADEHILSGDEQQLIQVFVNLINNASDASVNEETITISSVNDQDKIIIEVVDQGKGISDADKKQLFEPFFTTKEAGEGMGLGLSIVYNIIHDHGGDIKVVDNINNHHNRGSRFIISLSVCELTKQSSREH